jgi:hypothetical protein
VAGHDPALPPTGALSAATTQRRRQAPRRLHRGLARRRGRARPTIVSLRSIRSGGLILLRSRCITDQSLCGLRQVEDCTDSVARSTSPNRLTGGPSDTTWRRRGRNPPHDGHSDKLSDDGGRLISCLHDGHWTACIITSLPGGAPARLLLPTPARSRTQIRPPRRRRTARGDVSTARHERPRQPAVNRNCGADVQRRSSPVST